MSYVGTFMGAAVRGFTSNIGWNVGSPSSLSVQLVDDPVMGAEFSPPDIGTPCFFTFEGFTFNGLFQKYEQRKDTSGSPVYEVIIVDPREILDGAKVIVSSYSGTVGGIKNLFNAYGACEAAAFGGSQSNESGMPWTLIKAVVTTLANNPAGSIYGSPLSFRGYTYSLDLSEVPTPPAYYRIGGGVSMSLMEAIAQVCEDAGYDFFVELVGYTIKVRTVSRINAAPLGTISSLADSGYGVNLARSSVGLELRNEQTAAFLIGGDYTELYLTDAVTQFWGMGITGLPVTGTAVTLPLYDASGALLQNVSTEYMELNATPVADIIGSVSYPCTTLEMRLAQGSFEAWQSYMSAHRPAMATIIGINSVFKRGASVGAGAGLGVATMRPNFVNDAAAAANINAIVSDIMVKETRVYEFVRGFADEYMGKKFLVALPFLLTYTDTETARIHRSYEVADGGYLAEDATPLGLSTLNADTFKTKDNRFRSFVAFPLSALSPADFSKVSPNGTVVEDNVLYISSQVDSQIIENPIPYVILTLSSPLTDMPADGYGGVETLAKATLQSANSTEAQKTFKRMAMPFRLAPATRTPSAVAIPLKSNTITYGPWYAQGAYGNVRVEYDPSLTPWNYGGYTVMATAATSRVSQAITSQQVVETGTLEYAGNPSTSLGNLLEAGGPNITGIDVQINTQGVTTSYRFATFSPKKLGVSKNYIEKLRRQSLANLELKRAIRGTLKDNLLVSQAINSAARTWRGFLEKQAKARKRETPHDVLHAWVEADTDVSPTRVRQQVSMATMEEAINLANADVAADYQNTAIMGFNGLVRPFATSAAAAGNIPKYTVTNYIGELPNIDNLDPWQDSNDIEVYSWGSAYQGVNAYLRGGDNTDARVFGLRAPLVLVGYGFDTDCNFVPGTASGYTTNYQYRQDTWKAGPLDPLWDEKRGVWTVHDVVRCTTGAEIGASATGTVTAKSLFGSDYSLVVHNWFQQEIPAGTNMFAGYCANDNRWYSLNGGIKKQHLRGAIASGTVLAALGSATMTIAGATGIMTVYNHFNAACSGNIIAGWVEDDAKYYVLAADC